MAVNFISQLIDIRGDSFDPVTGEPLNGKWFDIKQWSTQSSQDASTASTKALEATDSAASALASANTAITKADEASVSAGDAATSLAGITTQLDEATTSANNAAASATAASTSASQALASEQIVGDFSTDALNSKNVASEKALEASLNAITIANNLQDVETRQSAIEDMQTDVVIMHDNVVQKEISTVQSASNAAISETNAANSAASVNASNIVHIEDSGLDNELLTYLKTIDGPGSGLEADKLDGYEGSDYVLKSEVNAAIGNINNPLLDLPLNNSLAMKQGVGSVTFTRSTTATYIDRYGVLQTAQIDEPRFEKDGLLIEGSSTNLLLYSNNPSGVNYTKTLNTTDTTSPSGINDAVKLVADGSDNEHYTQLVVTVPDDNTTYTNSIFVKKGTLDTIAFAAYITGGTVSTIVHSFTFSTETGSTELKIDKLSNGWYRLSHQITNNTSGATTLYNRVYIGPRGINTSTDTLYVYGFQTESLPFASSYIPTTDTAVTRGPDYCNITGANNQSNNSFSVLMDLQLITKRPSGSYRIVQFSSDAYAHNIAMWNGNDYHLLGYYNSQSGASGQVSTDGSLLRIAYTYDMAIHTLYTNGISLRSRLVDSYNYPISDIKLNDNGLLYFHIKNFRIFDKCLTAQEIALA